MVHENKPLDAGIEMHNGADGSYIFSFPTVADIGRGATADIDPRYEGAESWANNKDDQEFHYMVVSQDGEIIPMPCRWPTIRFGGTVIWEERSWIIPSTMTMVLKHYLLIFPKWDWENEQE